MQTFGVLDLCWSLVGVEAVRHDVGCFLSVVVFGLRLLTSSLKVGSCVICFLLAFVSRIAGE